MEPDEFDQDEGDGLDCCAMEELLADESRDDPETWETYDER